MSFGAIRVPLPEGTPLWVALILSVGLTVAWYLFRRSLRRATKSHEEKSLESWQAGPQPDKPKLYGRAAERERQQDATQSLPLIAKLLLTMGRARGITEPSDWGALEVAVFKHLGELVPEEEVESLSAQVRRDKRNWKALAKAFCTAIRSAAFTPSEIDRLVRPALLWPHAGSSSVDEFVQLVAAELRLA